MRIEESTRQRFQRQMNWLVNGVYLSIRLGVRLTQRRLRLTLYYLRMGKYHSVLPPHVNRGSILPIYRHQPIGLTCLRMRLLNAVNRWSSRLGTYWTGLTTTNKSNMQSTNSASMVQAVLREFLWNTKTTLSTVRLKLQTIYWQLSRFWNRS